MAPSHSSKISFIVIAGIIMDVAILFVLIFINGAFAMSEIALVASRKARLQRLANVGDAAAAAAILLGENPTRFLSTIQIGITSIAILSGIFGEVALAKPFALWLQSLGIDKEASQICATVLVVVVITYFSIVLGELVPKRIGQINAEAIARRVARPMLFLATLTKPFVRLLTFSTELVLRLLGVKTPKDTGVTEEEIHAMLEEGSDAGVIEQQEHAMVRNVFRLDDRQLTSLMVPRTEVVYLDIEDAIEINMQKIETATHSRFAVCKGGWEEVLGIVSAKRLLARAIRGGALDLKDNLEPAIFVPATITGMELLDNFRASSADFGLVVDEYGDIKGLVTLRDVMEAITGEFKPHNPEDAWAVERDDGSWLLDGLIPVPEFKDRLNLNTVPEEDKERYHSLSGMVMLLLGRIPRAGDHVDWEQWRFEVVDMDDKRIDKVLVSKLAPSVEAPERL